MIYELRDDPDDLPIFCETLAEAGQRGKSRAARLGVPILIYQMDPVWGETFLEAVE